MCLFLIKAQQVPNTMNTALSRLNAVFAFSLTVLSVLTLLCFLSTAFKDKSYPAVISTKTPNAVVKAYENMATGPDQRDRAMLKLNIEADLTSLFDWNTKQLFVMLIAHYKTKRNIINQVVLWDKIIKRGDPATITASGIKSKYPFFDDGFGLLGNGNVTLQLSWNVIPQAGRLPTVKSGTQRIHLPTQYSSAY